MAPGRGEGSDEELPGSSSGKGKKKMPEEECSSKNKSRKRPKKPAAEAARKRKYPEPPPQVLHEGYCPTEHMSTEDEALRDIDVPERLQGDESTWLQFDHKEAEWITGRVFGSEELDSRREELVEHVTNVLRLVQVEKYEVPFIGSYRKEQCFHLVEDCDDSIQPKLRHFKPLWDVVHWHKNWIILQTRKRKLQEALVRLNSEKLLETLAEADSEEAVEDVETALSVHEVSEVQGGYKRPKRRASWVDPNVASLVKYFGMSASQFSENLRHSDKKHEVEDLQCSPNELSAGFAGFTVMAAARNMLAAQISMEPLVRQRVRRLCMQSLTVTTKPTLAGYSSDEYVAVKWLRDKPLSKFRDGSWLLVQKAEKEELLVVFLNFCSCTRLREKLEAAFLSGAGNHYAKLWNEQRKLVLEEAIQIIMPSMEKEARITLAREARRWVASKCEEQLWNLVSVSPYKPSSSGSEMTQESVFAKVVACSWAQSVATFIALDTSGKLLGTLSGVFYGSRNSENDRQNNTLQRLAEFVDKHRPDVFVVGACNKVCRNLFQMVQEAITQATEVLERVDVVYGNEEIAVVYESLPFSLEQLPDTAGIVRRAVALGRYIQNPLAMFSLVLTSAEKFPVQLHPLQHFLTPAQVEEVIQRVMVTVTSQVGVDISVVAGHEWQLDTLRYVSGLGPRTSKFLKRAIRGLGKLNSRRQLVSAELMKSKVYTNCAGFLRVRPSGLLADHTSPLDDTRIHPDFYEIAQEIAQVVYCKGMGIERSEVDTVTPKAAFDFLRQNPATLLEMDIQDYVTGGRVGVRTLQDIKSGLLYGYAEIRKEYERPSDEEVFFWLTKAPTDIVNKPVTVVVRDIQKKGAICTLESGSQALLPFGEVPADAKAGSVLKCTVSSVNLEFSAFDLVIQQESEVVQVVDDYYKPDEDYFCKIKEDAAKKLAENQKLVIHRPIVHRLFKNISKAEALEGLEDGDFVIIPSSKGPSFLSLVLKLRGQIHVDIDILELKKDAKDIDGLLQLGKVLNINGEAFGSLDEVASGFVQPLLDKLRAIVQHTKFKEGTVEQVTAVRRAEKSENPAYISYHFSHCDAGSVSFLLSYLKGAVPRQEKVAVCTRGYTFRGKLFSNPDSLLSYFLKHVGDDLLRQAPPSNNRACRSCGQDGHMARECPSKISKVGEEDRACYKCGEAGHLSRECPSGSSGRTCRKCGEEGHIAKDCLSEGGSGSRACHKCGEDGHIAKECPFGSSARACRKCGEEGHLAKDCPSGGGSCSRVCYKCGEEGHIATGCPSAREGGTSCYKCNQEDHLSRDCPVGRRCYNCNEEGHLSRDCPNKASGGGRGCFHCGEDGHVSRNCPNKPADGGRGCFHCGQDGHSSRNCPNKASAGGSLEDTEHATASNGWGNGGTADQTADSGGCGGWGTTKTAGTALSGDCSTKSSAGGTGSDGWGTVENAAGGWGAAENAGRDSFRPNKATGGGSVEDTQHATVSDGWGLTGNADHASASASDGWGTVGSGGCGAIENAGCDSSLEHGPGDFSNKPSGGGRGCFHCGEDGHISRNCPKKSADRGTGCFHCGEDGHVSRNCPNKPFGGGRGCFHCGEDGHISRNCPTKPSNGCFQCGKDGHMSRNCPNKPTGGGGGCFQCGEDGHISRNCPSKASGGGRGCFQCGEEGHFSRNCPNKPSGRGRGCFHCGEDGHISRNCPSKASGGGRGCFQCGEDGHIFRNCPKKASAGGRVEDTERATALHGWAATGNADTVNHGAASDGWGTVGNDGGWGTTENPGWESVASSKDKGKAVLLDGGCGSENRETTDLAGSSRGGCYCCGAETHMLRDCPKKTCYLCGQAGHKAEFCTSKSDKGGTVYTEELDSGAGEKIKADSGSGAVGADPVHRAEEKTEEAGHGSSEKIGSGEARFERNTDAAAALVVAAVQDAVGEDGTADGW